MVVQPGPEWWGDASCRMGECSWLRQKAKHRGRRGRGSPHLGESWGNRGPSQGKEIAITPEDLEGISKLCPQGPLGSGAMI